MNKVTWRRAIAGALTAAAGVLIGLAACTPQPVPAPTTQATSAPTYSASPVSSASPTAVSCANVPPVYHPARLSPLGPCVTFKGLVIANIHETLDGDHHLWIEPDAGYEGLLNAANDYRGHKALVAEIVPACTSPPADATAATHCPASKVREPNVGDHVLITGPHVLDTVHGWKEIHPVASLVVLPALAMDDE